MKRTMVKMSSQLSVFYVCSIFLLSSFEASSDMTCHGSRFISASRDGRVSIFLCLSFAFSCFARLSLLPVFLGTPQRLPGNFRSSVVFLFLLVLFVISLTHLAILDSIYIEHCFLFLLLCAWPGYERVHARSAIILYLTYVTFCWRLTLNEI